MTDLAVRRLDVTYRLEPDDVEELARLEQTFRYVAERGLERAVRAISLPAGEWCVRRLDVPVQIRLRDADRVIEDEWSTALAAALRQALDARSPDVVHYRSRRAALLELVRDTVVGRGERLWAWERIGVRSTSDPSPVSTPADAILAALCRAPHDALGVVVAAVASAGLAAVDRALGVDGWLAVAEIVRAALGLAPNALEQRVSARGDAGAEALLHAQSRAEAILDTSRLVAAARRCRLRVTTERVAAWAPLAVFEVDPAVFWGRSGNAVVAAVAAGLGWTPPAADLEATTEARRKDPSPDIVAHDEDRLDGAETSPLAASRRITLMSAGATADDEELRRADRDVPLRPDVGTDRDIGTSDGDHSRADVVRPSTAWAGLLFLHNVAHEVGLPHLVADDVILAPRPLRWVLHALAGQLVPVAAEDPAALAFAGVGPTDPPPSSVLDPATPAELDRIRELAAAWSAAAADRMAAYGDDDDCVGEGRPASALVTSLAARRGTIDAEPGWIEVHLDLANVDLDVRRAGLDLDPGWIPWLACVLRFVYE